MRIYPRDLPADWHVKFVHLRAAPSAFGADPPLPRKGALGDAIASGVPMDEERKPAVLAAATPQTYPFIIPFSIWSGMLTIPGVALLVGRGEEGLLGALLCLLGSAALAATGVLGANITFGKLNRRPITANEVERVLEKTTDPSARQFLELLRDAVRQPLPADAEANAREALAGVAEAISRLPVIRVEPLDTGKMLAEAAELEARAAGQPDRVMAESLQRRANAIRHRVTAHQHSSLVSARAEALGAEIEAQIAALREGLAAFEAPTADAGSLRALAEAARQVATEAAQMGVARAELAASTESWPVVENTAGADVQPVGVTVRSGTGEPS
jgi:hypothetical protein